MWRGGSIFTAFVYFYRLQQLIVDYCVDLNTYESFETKINVHITMMKLGLFLFLQLKDGTLSSGIPAPWSTSQALWVWPLRTRRGWSHHSSYRTQGTAKGS